MLKKESCESKMYEKYISQHCISSSSEMNRSEPVKEATAKSCLVVVIIIIIIAAGELDIYFSFERRVHWPNERFSLLPLLLLRLGRGK